MRRLRHCCLLLVVAVLAAACGLGDDPVVASEDEVLEALLALREGAEGRLTASLELDEGEVRDVLRDDEEARALFEEEFGDGDVDDLVAELTAARDRLAEHALLLATGADGSGRVAVESRGEVWLDLRAGSDIAPGDDPRDGFRVDLQARVDWAVASELFSEPDLLGDLDEAAAQLAPFLGTMPETDAVQRVLLGLLGGELVAISGEVGPALLDALGALGGPAADAAVDGSTLPQLDLDPRDLAATALSFDGFRRDGEDTLVDVTVELRAAASAVLDELAAAPDAAGLTFDDVAAARADLDELPEQLMDVAVLRFGPEGTLLQVRADLLDLAVQLARAATPDDPDLAVVERVAGRLDATGLFADLAVTGVGTTPTVLGDPTAVATPDEVVRAVSGLLFSGLGRDGGDLRGLEDLLPDESTGD